MEQFYKGTLSTMIGRLCSAISSFDKEWKEKCVPATEEQIQKLKDIFKKYNYEIPEAYLYYLRAMGQNDGGLLEREWDGYSEPDINIILKIYYSNNNFYKLKDLEKGFFLFSYHWTDAHFYLKLDTSKDNPVVTDMDNEYYAGSFEKYLFQKAFKMYKETFKYSISDGLSACDSNERPEKDCRNCPVYGRTTKERIDYARQYAKFYGLREAWFSDGIHYFCYNEKYTIEINVKNGFYVGILYNDEKLEEQARGILENLCSFYY